MIISNIHILIKTPAARIENKAIENLGRWNIIFILAFELRVQGNQFIADDHADLFPVNFKLVF